MHDTETDAILAEQVEYYRARAPEHDRWWRRTHQYELAPERKAEWDEEVARLDAAVAALVPAGDVLELACGTGLWTERLLAFGARVTAVDAAPEMLDIARQRLAAHGAADHDVDLVEADVFGYAPTRRYDAVFFSFWLSHVPPTRFGAFWELVGAALLPGARAVFIDNRWGDGTWAGAGEKPELTQGRSDLSTGETYRVVKIYDEPDELEAKLGAIGWEAAVTASGRSFIYGWARPRG